MAVASAFQYVLRVLFRLLMARQNSLVRNIVEEYCDGLGACLGECPQGAITIEERVADEFDEEATKLHLEGEKHTMEELPCGCPSTTVTRFEKQDTARTTPSADTPQPSMLRHWPVQLALVPTTAPFLQELTWCWQ